MKPTHPPEHRQHAAHLLPEAQRCRDARCIRARHAAPDLLAELPDVAARRLQVLEQDGQVRRLLPGLREEKGAQPSAGGGGTQHSPPHAPSYLQEGAQSAHLHPHAVQGTLGELRAQSGRREQQRRAARCSGLQCWVGPLPRAAATPGFPGEQFEGQRGLVSPRGTQRFHMEPRSSWMRGTLQGPQPTPPPCPTAVPAAAAAREPPAGLGGLQGPPGRPMGCRGAAAALQHFTLMWSASCMVQSSACSARWMLYRCCTKRDHHRPASLECSHTCKHTKQVRKRIKKSQPTKAEFALIFNWK